MTATVTQRTPRPTAPVSGRVVPVPDLSIEVGSSMNIGISASEIAEGVRKVRSHGMGTSGRVALLGVVLAELENVPFEDAARLLRVKPPRLEKMMHGVESIPKANDARWTTIAEILRLLHTVLRSSATARWLNTELASLGGVTPISAIEKGRANDVLEVVRGYRESAFS